MAACVGKALQIIGFPIGRWHRLRTCARPFRRLLCRILCRLYRIGFHGLPEMIFGDPQVVLHGNRFAVAYHAQATRYLDWSAPPGAKHVYYAATAVDLQGNVSAPVYGHVHP